MDPRCLAEADDATSICCGACRHDQAAASTMSCCQGQAAAPDRGQAEAEIPDQGARLAQFPQPGDYIGLTARYTVKLEVPTVP